MYEFSNTPFDTTLKPPTRFNPTAVHIAKSLENTWETVTALKRYPEILLGNGRINSCKTRVQFQAK
jgi:hypothetical protein